MWKTLKHGEQVSTGDTLRYQSNSNSLTAKDEAYLVIRTDQHYFEIIQKSANENTTEPPRRKVVRYLDIGYNILVERWSEQ
jgi:hypothetical protein